MRLCEHSFVREPQPIDHFICRGCRFPHIFCCCDPSEDDLPTYRGFAAHYPKEKHS